MTQLTLLDLLAVHAPPVPEWYLDHYESFGKVDSGCGACNAHKSATAEWPWFYARSVLAARPSMEVGG